jgi:PAS domain S-box-containing protein
MQHARILDAERLSVLRATRLLDSAVPLPSFDRLTGLAARMLGTRVAMVTLIDADRQKFASACGLPPALDEKRESPLTYSICRYVVEDDAPLIIADTSADERLRDNPAVTVLGAAAYAGFPLRAPNGRVLGSFCVVDSKTRDWTTDELATIADLAGAAESEIALRLSHGEQVLAAARMQAVLDSAHDAYVSIDADSLVVAWNGAAERLFGWTAADAIGRSIADLIIPEYHREAHLAGMARVRATLRSQLSGTRLQLTAVDRAGREFPAEMSLQVCFERDVPFFHAFLHDISDRIDALVELERQRRELDDDHTFLHSLLDSLDTGVAACDGDGNLTFFNRALRDVHGRDAEPGESGESWAQQYDLYAPDGVTRLGADEVPLARAHAGEIVRGQHLVVRAGVGEQRRFVSNARPIDSADGRRLGAVVAMHDITETYRIEELRRARHAVAQVLSEATNAEQAAISAVRVITDRLGLACGEYWQVTADETRIERLSSHVTGGLDLAAFTNDEPLSFALGEGVPGLVWERGGEMWTGEPPNAAGRHEMAVSCGLRTAIGLPVRSGRRVIGVLAFYASEDLPHDPEISAMLDTAAAHLGRFVERRRAEDLTLALSAARRDFDRVVGQLNDYVWTVEVVPGEPGRLVYGSPNATGVFGGMPQATEDDRATLITDRVHPDDAAKVPEFHQTLGQGRPAELECRIIGYDGVERWVWTRGRPRIEDGRILVDGISTNITERRELAEQREQMLEQQREQVEQLRELDRMKEELSAVVIHELRNPLGVIRGYTEMLLDNPRLDDLGRRHASVVERTTGHLQGLVDDLLDLARLDAGHIDIEPLPMPVGRLVHDVVDNHRPGAYAKRLTITERLDTHLPVLGDAQRLRQALDNLMSNAIKYTPEDGTVTVVAQEADDRVVIEISDTGIGIPPEQYPHLFSRFFRASNATAKGIKGTGLGLAVTKAIVEAHHGTLIAHPSPAGGTTFTISLPAGGAFQTSTGSAISSVTGWRTERSDQSATGMPSATRIAATTSENW